MRRGPAAQFCAIVALAATFGITPAAYQQLHWRFVGPLRGGRTTSISGVPGRPNVFYIGVADGGVWKTDDAGRTWTAIFDRAGVGSIGAVAVARTYRSATARTNRSTRGRPGRISVAQQISAIAVDPANPNRLFVAVLGHPYGPNAQRGVYRSTDGGTTFTRVLARGDDVGAYDVAVDPHDPNVVYATLWAARQAPWEIGGSFEIPGSGIFKSTDGGTTWTQLTAGLPGGIGRAEIAPAPSDPRVVYAYADTETNGGAVYRSDDAGAHFTQTDNAPEIAQRGDDLVSLAVDPRAASIVYLTNTSFYRSTDSGKTFVPIKGAPGGDDYHDVWIDPSNANAIALASDQGATISVNGGRTWSSWYNQPTAQMYHVSADDRLPYRVCGGQQESGSACVQSRGAWGQITQRDWYTAGAQEYGYVVPDPLHPGIFFGGKLERFDERTGQVREVSPVPLGSKRYRLVRTEPIAFDHFDRRRLYFGSNVIFASDDGGTRWHAISPDLTRAHPGVPAVLGPFERDDPERGAHRGVVYAIAPSYRHAGTMWAGTDDGLVWITRDGGKRWRNVTPPQLTPWSKVSQIDASRFDDETAFVAVNRFRLDDLHPYAYVTRDGGVHWRSIVAGLPLQPLNAVRQDPRESRLLYAAGENGVDVSFDGGERWQSLQLDLPHTSVRDLIVHGDDVIIATHGRGFWILDDAAPLRTLAQADPLFAGARAYLFSVQRAYRVRNNVNTDTPLPPEEPAGQNPPDGAIVDYALSSPARRVVLTILDAHGSEVRRYASDDAAPAPIPHLDKPAFWQRPFVRPATGAGAHRFVWDLRTAPPASPQQDLTMKAVAHATPRVPRGALVPPGRYVVRLEAGDVTLERPFDVVMDPRVHVSSADLQSQYALAVRLAAVATQAGRAAGAIRPHDAKGAGELQDVEALAGAALESLESADAAPTAAQSAAAATLEGRLRALTHLNTPKP